MKLGNSELWDIFEAARQEYLARQLPGVDSKLQATAQTLLAFEQYLKRVTGQDLGLELPKQVVIEPVD